MEPIATVYDIFVAHSGDAKDFSDRLAHRLSKAKLRVFFDARELAAGTAFDVVVERAIRSSSAFLFVVSARSVEETSYARTELDWALKAERPLFAIQAEGHEGLKPPPALDGVSPISTEGDRIAQAVSILVRHLALADPAPTPRPEPETGTWIIITVMVAAMVIVLAVWNDPQRQRSSPQLSAPPADMGRISGARLNLGLDAPAAFKSWCQRQGAEESECEKFLQRSPTRQVAVETFDLDRTEVTSEDFAGWVGRKLREGVFETRPPHVTQVSDGAVLWDPLCQGIGAHMIVNGAVRERSPDAPSDPRQPAICVTAEAASSYCQEHGKRLPTEEEWELAAGGKEKRPLPWSVDDTKSPSCSDAVFDRIEHGRCADRPHGPMPVDTANRDETPEHVRALGGNVSEWVVSDRDVTPRFRARGGSWGGLTIDLHPAKVVRADPTAVTWTTVGFRCARTPAFTEAE